MSVIFHRNLWPALDATHFTMVSSEVGSPGPMMKSFTLPEDAQEVEAELANRRPQRECWVPLLRKELHLRDFYECRDPRRKKDESRE